MGRLSTTELHDRLRDGFSRALADLPTECPGFDPRRARRPTARRWWARPLPALVALLVTAAAVRAGLIAAEWPAGNSDEGTLGLMALHIAEGRHLPVFYYGQSYMGPGQAYLGAALFRLATPGPAALRAGLLLLFLAFLVLLFVLTRRLYGARAGVVAVGLLTLGSRELYGDQLVAIGGLPETLLAGTALLLIGHGVLAGADRMAPARYRVALAGWGLVTALGLWSTMLVAPFVAGSAILLRRAGRRRAAAGQARRGAARAVAVGLLVGIAPVAVHDLTVPPAKSSVAAFVRLYTAGGSGLQPGDAGGPLHRLANTVGTSLAHATGGSALAHHGDAPAWPVGWSGSRQGAATAPADAAWGAVLVVLWLAATVLTVRQLRSRAGPRAAAYEARLWGRLALLVSAALTIAAFAASRAPGLSPDHHARYLVGVLVATPAVVHPLRYLRWPASSPTWWRRHGTPRRLVLLAALAVLLLGTADAYRDAAGSRGDDQTRALAGALVERGVTRVYTDYWTCNRLAFTSRERVVCAVVDRPPTGFRHGLDRYRPYRAAVLADPGAAYVFAAGGADARAAAGWGRCTWRDRWSAAGYEIFEPAGGCRPDPDPRGSGRF